jgi:dolichyl-phosphate-mannose-protein mannosyltransferase
MQLNKKDAITIVALSIIFFSLATWNLGLAQTPTATATFSNGQSFYLDLGSQIDVHSVYFLLQDGSYNLTIYSGSPENWTSVKSGATYIDYYKWNEIGIDKFTQYIRVDFGKYDSPAIIAEAAVSNSDGKQITITNITNLSSENNNVHNLIDEQNKVELPATYMSQTYFDEIYFVRTAEQYLHLQSPYEWTHPPLGKLIQAAGITIFGFSPFGWRLAGVIFGTLMIPIMYLLGKRLFGSWIGAFASAFLLTFDFMHFTMARMGTADTYVVFFSLLSQLFFFIYFSNVVKKGWSTSVFPLFMAVIFFFLGFSTKWLVLYSAVGMLALLAVLRLRDLAKLKESIGRKYAAFFDHPFLLLLGFIALGIGIYFVIYIPDMLTGRPFITFPLGGPNDYGNAVVNLQFKMYEYHANLVATHSFASAWWSWPFMVSPRGYVPLWLNVTYLPNNIDSTISVLGNPALWWVGFVLMIVLTERAIRGKELLFGLKNKLKKKTVTSEAPIQVAPADSTVAPTLVAEQTTEVTPPISAPEDLEPPKQDLRRRWDIAAIFIVVVFFSSWIPYIFISRVTFIYHFFVSMPFLCLASAYFINKYWNTRGGKIATIIFFASVVALFAVFYPVISGAPVSTDWIHKLKWFPSWYFAP